jgi:hypothetical protein
LTPQSGMMINWHGAVAWNFSAPREVIELHLSAFI